MKEAKDRLSCPAVVVLTQDDGIGAPLGELTTLLARVISEDFGDDTRVVELDGEAAHHGKARLEAPRVSLRAPADLEGAVALLHAELPALARHAAYTLLDISKRSPSFQRDLVRRLGEIDLGHLTGRAVHLTRSKSAPSVPGWSTLRTDLLAPRVETPSAKGLRSWLGAKRDLAVKEMGRLTGLAPEPRGVPYPTARMKPDFCRIRLDLAGLPTSAKAAPSELPAPLRASLARWARAITDRRMGVALGGSGSWGYAHVALLEALDGAGVPIDLIASASSGSLMGAYYVVLGREGLDLAKLRGREFQAMSWRSTMSTAAIEHQLDVDLGAVAIEDHEILFFPVATNLTNAQPEAMTGSTVGFGVRASGSAPGFFASTVADGALYVDGAVADNVPAQLLEHMGAAWVIAANALPPPNGERVTMPRTRSRALLDEISPSRRAKDLIASLSLMFHDSGDVQTSETRVLFDPPQERLVLFRTFEFHRAEEILTHVRQEAEFGKAVSDCVSAWSTLKSPRKAGSR
ncbi:MAG: patatin-like phospholipase family protein [Byssovorax sp.]